MQIRVKRAFYGDEKGVKAGQIIEVADIRGKQLIQRGLAEQIGGGKDAAAHLNKMAPNPPAKDGDSGGDGAPKSAADVLAMADADGVQFMTFKSAAKKLLGDKTPATKAEIVAALEELATNPDA